MARLRSWCSSGGGSLVLALVFACAVSAPAGALEIGPRAGFSFSPDQLVLGVQANVAQVTNSVWFVPSLDLGFGSSVSVVAINADLIWDMPHLPNTNVNFFVLAGPTIANFSFDGGAGDTEIGLSLGGGMRVPIRKKSSYYIEARFGLGDIPDVKLMAGALLNLWGGDSDY